MKKSFLSLCFLLLISSIHSQQASFLSGPEFVNKNGAFKYVIGEDKTCFYVLRLGTKGSGVQNNIEKCNKKTFAVEWVKDISFESDLGEIPSGDQFQRSTIVLSRGKIYFFLSLVETRKNSRSIYMKSMSAADGQIYGKAELLATEEKYSGLSLFNVQFSPDTTKALIKFDALYSSTIKKVKLVELKTNKELFDKELPTSDSNGDLECTSASTDNVGNLLCIYSRKKGSPGLGKMSFNSTSLKTFDLNIGVNDHAYLSSNILQYGDNFDYAVITGIFVDIPCKSKKTCTRREGNYYMKIDLNKSKIITAVHEYFDDATHVLYDAIPDNNNANPYEKLFCFSSIIDKASEDVYSMAASGFNGMIFVTRFNKEGKVIWTKVLPRSSMVYHPGFAYAYEKGNLYFIYLDNPKNIENIDINNFEVKKIKSQSAVTGANVICISITKEGALNRTVLSTNEKDTANFMPDVISSLSDQPPIFNLKNRDKEKYIRFEFQK